MKLFLISLLLISSYTQATIRANVGACGDYLVKGVVRLKEKKINLLVHEKTQSEYSIFFPISEEATLSLFLNKPILVKLKLEKPFDGMKGFSSTLLNSPELRIPDPLNPSDTGFELIKENICQNNNKKD